MGNAHFKKQNHNYSGESDGVLFSGAFRFIIILKISFVSFGKISFAEKYTVPNITGVKAQAQIIHFIKLSTVKYPIIRLPRADSPKYTAVLYKSIKTEFFTGREIILFLRYTI